MLSGRYPSDEFAELRPRLTWDRIGGTLTARAGRRPRRNRQRRDDPRPRPLRRVPRRARARARPAWASSTRRWCSSRGSARLRARRVHLADRGHHARPGGRLPGAGRTRQDALLARRSAGPPARARAGDRRAWSANCAACRAPRPSRGWSTDHDLGRDAPPRTCCSISATRSARRGACPTIARSSSSGTATNSATGGSACWRRFGGQRPRALGDGRGGAHPRTRADIDVETMWSDDGFVVRFPDTDEPPRSRPAPAAAGRGRAAAAASARRHRAVRRAFPRGRRAGAAAAAPPSGRADAAVAAAQAGVRPARRRGAVRLVPGAARNLPRVPARPVRRPCAARRPRRASRARTLRVATVDTRKAVAVRLVAAVRLHGELHLRRRRAARGTAGAGAARRPVAAARAAGRHRAAGAARRVGHRRGGSAAAARSTRGTG